MLSDCEASLFSVARVSLELLGNCGRRIAVRRTDAGKAKGCIKTKLPQAPRTIGEHIHAKRVFLGLRQGDVAQMFGVRPNTVGSWEANHFSPMSRTREKVVAWLGFDAPDQP